MKVTSDTNYSDFRSGHKTPKAKEPGSTPTSRTEASYIKFLVLLSIGLAGSILRQVTNGVMIV